MVSDHFADIRKMVELGSGFQREIDDIALTRYACYLTAQNGDAAKPPVAFAQTYSAVQTHKQEIIEQRMLEGARELREKNYPGRRKNYQALYMKGGLIGGGIVI